MKVNNTSFFMNDGVFGTSNTSERSNNNPSKSSGISINGSSFALQNDPIAAKREEARKKAMKIIGDAFANDRKIDEDLDARSEHIRKLKGVQNDANKAISEMESDRAALRDEYGIDTDSQEEKELQLLEKEFRARQKGSDVQLTKEDMEEIAKIKAKGLTEYQSRSMEMLDYEKPYLDAAYEAKAGIEEENLTIAAIKRELHEELGADTEVICRIGTVSDHYNLIHRHNINNYFLCKVISFGDKNMTQQEIDDFHLSTLKMTYEQAVSEYEKRRETPLGRLICNRELPVLKRAKEILDSRGI